jgi:hypothetical protein
VINRGRECKEKKRECVNKEKERQKEKETEKKKEKEREQVRKREIIEIDKQRRI